MKAYLPCLFILLLVGCSPQRRLNRLVARNPELIRVDTFRLQKIYPIPGKTAIMPVPAERFYHELVEKHLVSVTDTITNITVNISDNNSGDSLYISINIPPDSLQIDEPIPIQKITVTQQPIWKTILENLPVLLLIFAIIILIVKMK